MVDSVCDESNSLLFNRLSFPPVLQHSFVKIKAHRHTLNHLGISIGANDNIHQTANASRVGASALQVAGDDPEIQHYARQLDAELGAER